VNISVDFGYRSINHFGEEVCGDRVVMKGQKDGFIGVLADGMGSGVKANILSTMGSTILSTMFLGGESVESAVDVVVRSLPVCSERGLNYCTFSVVNIDQQGVAKLVEFDNPQAWIIRNCQVVQPERTLRPVGDKKIWESSLLLIEGDIIVVTSDGAVNAGVDNQFSFRWNWDSVANWLCQRAHTFSSARRLANELVEAVNNLYGGKPTDDVTAMVIRIPKEEPVNIMYGPPEYPEDDAFMVHEFMDTEGVKIICGGTTSNIVSRVLDSPVVTMPETASDGVPPISFLAEVDLVTEGVLTVTRAGDILERYYAQDHGGFQELDGENGAAILAKQLVEHCTELRVFIGKAQNPGYEGKDVPLDLNMKMKAIDKICSLLEQQGKPVMKFYY
jgi:hypothetical protein